MNPKLLLLSFLVATLFQSCIAQKLSQSIAIENAMGERLYAKFSGRCFVKTTGQNSYLLLVNTNNSSDSYDKAIIVFSEGNQTKPAIDEQDIYEFFIPNHKRYIIVNNPKNNKIFIAGLTDQAAKESIDRFKSNEIVKSALTNQDVLGYGLSYMSNTIWNMAKIKESKYKSPFNTLDYANMTNRQAATALPPAEEENLGDISCAQGACTSGGAGSSSCAITEAPLGQECSVTCNSGYYACCVSSSVRCYCCKSS